MAGKRSLAQFGRYSSVKELIKHREAQRAPSVERDTCSDPSSIPAMPCLRRERKLGPVISVPQRTSVLVPFLQSAKRIGKGVVRVFQATTTPCFSSDHYERKDV